MITQISHILAPFCGTHVNGAAPWLNKSKCPFPMGASYLICLKLVWWF